MGTERDMDMFVIKNNTLEEAYEIAKDLRAKRYGNWSCYAREFLTLDQYQGVLKHLERGHIRRELSTAYVAQHHSLDPIMENEENYPIVVARTNDSLLHDILISEGFVPLEDAIDSTVS